MTVNGHPEGYPQDTNTISVGKGGVLLPVVPSTCYSKPYCDSFEERDPTEMTLSEIANGVFFVSYNKEFEEISWLTKQRIKWKSSGRNENDKEKYHVTKGVKYPLLNRTKYFPFDDNRITIDGKYLNASPVKVGANGFIAMENPMPTAFFRFWEMVWRKKVNTIFLITNIGNSRIGPYGKVEYHRYWPQGKGVVSSFGRLEVKNLGTKRSCIGKSSAGTPIYLDERTYSIKTGKSAERSITQLHYNQWEDYKAPDLDSFIRVIIKVWSCAKKAIGPLVVQSCRGVGRAGTFIAAYTLISDVWMQLMESNGSFETKISIKQRVLELREQRYKMVLNTEQYLFIYEFVQKNLNLYTLQF